MRTTWRLPTVSVPQTKGENFCDEVPKSSMERKYEMKLRNPRLVFRMAAATAAQALSVTVLGAFRAVSLRSA